MNPEENKIFSCVWLLYYVNNFLPIREWRYEDIDTWILTGLIWCREVLFALKV